MRVGLLSRLLAARLRFRTVMQKSRTRTALLWLLAGSTPLASAADQPPGYAVVVARATQADPAWKEVVAALVAKHHATVITYDSAIKEALPEMQRCFPRYVCFVAKPNEVSREFVAQVHRLTRHLDDDPYTDCFWGILTGYDGTAALRLARLNQPLTIRKAAAGTDIALALCEQGTWYCELQKNRMVRKEPGHAAAELKGPDDTTKALVDLLNEYHADLFVTSGHATEHDWQIGYRYRNGSFGCEKGVLYGRDLAGRRYPIEAPNPKVYMPVGNCLMGHIDGRDAMALAFMNSAGVAQMLGYTVTTWFGYAGWGCLDYFVEQPGRYTFTEAFFANQHALIHRLATYFPELLEADIDENGRTSTSIIVGPKAKATGLTAEDGRGLLYDRDAMAFYGDPAWQARMAKTDLAWDQALSEKDGVWTFEIKPRHGAQTFEPINRNGSQRGGRPIIAYLPHRIRPAQVLEGAELAPVITDDFVLVPNPGQCRLDHPYRVVFRDAPLP
jgi:hypothetical protein